MRRRGSRGSEASVSSWSRRSWVSVDDTSFVLPTTVCHRYRERHFHQHWLQVSAGNGRVFGAPLDSPDDRSTRAIELTPPPPCGSTHFAGAAGSGKWYGVTSYISAYIATSAITAASLQRRSLQLASRRLETGEVDRVPAHKRRR